MYYAYFTDEQIARIPDFDQRVQAEAAQKFGTYNHADYQWSREPPDIKVDGDNICRTCYVWRRYPPGQRHFGWAWWRVCTRADCTCAHHATELWIA